MIRRGEKLTKHFIAGYRICLKYSQNQIIPGCIENQQSCPWGMSCNATSQLCEHLLCEDSLENGIIDTEPMPWLNGQTPPTAMGHTATIGCMEGYVIDHPEKMTVLARSGYNIQGR